MVSLGVVHADHFFVARRNIVTRDNWLRLAPRLIACWLLIASVYLICFIALVGLILAVKGDQRMSLAELYSVQFRGNLHQCVLTCALITLAAYVIEYYRRLNTSERAAAEMKTQLAEAQLQALQMQLHPHFLFNTLHAISVLIHKDAQLADRMIARLSEFLRLTLESSGAQEVTLRQELDFLNRYLAIEKLRFQERLSLQFDIAPETLDAFVPNLILQPLVENAMRHGIAASEGGGHLEITAHRAGEQLRLTISDSGVDVVESKPINEGIGLTNTRARLQQLYGAENCSLVWRRETHGGLTVELTFPLRLNERSTDES